MAERRRPDVAPLARVLLGRGARFQVDADVDLLEALTGYGRWSFG